MIVFYGSNGMSEAPFVFFLTWAVRRLIMWMVDDDVHHLIVAGGIAMGLAYLTRYDAVACVAAAGIVVGTTTYLRARTPPRLRRALLDVVLVSGPGFAAFLGWAATSWLITGQAFAQFSSQYGNAAILEQSGQTAAELRRRDRLRGGCIMLLAPTLVPIALWAGVIRLRRPYWPMLIVPLALFGAVLAFQAYSYAAGPDLSLPAVLHRGGAVQCMPGDAGRSRGRVRPGQAARQIRTGAARRHRHAAGVGSHTRRWHWCSR